MSGAPELDEAALSARVRASSLIGRVVAERYRIDEVLAMGGMGAVFRGEHVHMRKRVAVKVLHPTTQGFPELVQRFERESVVGAHITHPNVVSASDFGHLEDGSCYLVLEYVEGITLHELIKRGPVPTSRAVEIARQLGGALDAAHQLGICHRDLKPRNVMIASGSPSAEGRASSAGERDVVKLIDFGLAKVPMQRFSHSTESSDRVTLTTTGVVFGTVAYMAPETARGMHAVNELSDLYSVGILLYEMLTGLHPYDETEPTAVFLAHRTKKPRSFRERAPEVKVPAAIEAVAMRLLEKDPKRRFASAAEFVAALNAAAAGTMPAAPPAVEPAPAPATVRARAAPARRRSILPWITVGAVALAAGAVAIRGVPSLPLPGGAPEATAEARPTSAPTLEAPASAAPEAPSSSAPAAPPAAVASAEASAAPSASGAPVAEPSIADRVAQVDGLDGPAWRGVLKEASDAKDWQRGATAMLALARIEPTAFAANDLAPPAAAVAVAIELGDRATADKIYALLSGDALGSAGPDVLYQMVSFFGVSRGARRANEILRRKEVLARATPALRIALELKDTACRARPTLYDRATEEGDERTLAIFFAMRSPDCDPAAGGCCAIGDPKVEVAIAKLRLRIHK